MESRNQKVHYKHILFLLTILALLITTFDLADTRQDGLTGQAMGTANSDFIANSEDAIDIEGNDMGAFDAQEMAALDQNEPVPRNPSTITFVPQSTLSDLARNIEHAKSSSQKQRMAAKFRDLVNKLPEGPNKDFYQSELNFLLKN